MPLGLIGKKLGMTQVFNEEGVLIPVTVIQAGPCFVTNKRNIDRDGYEAVALGFDEKPERLVNRPDKGRFEAAIVPPCRIEREFRGPEAADLEVGQSVSVELFAEGEKVDIIGQTKGRGTAGTKKRFGTSPGPKTHGSMYHNRPGSNGASADPSRVYKGKKNPGRFGAARCTMKNLEVVSTMPEKNLIIVRGSIPGATNGYVMIRKRAEKN